MSQNDNPTLASLPAQIAALTETIPAPGQSRGLDEMRRLEALNAARTLVAALESPVERIIRDVVMTPPILMALRMGVQLGIFSQISQNPDHGVSSREIADKAGASPILVDQITRLLAAVGYIRQESVQCFKPSTLTAVIADPTMEATTRACFEIGNLCAAKAPEFFRKNSNQFPSSATDTPFQLAFNTQLTYFEWLGQNPELAKDFQQWMTLNQQATSNWVDWFNVQEHILDGFHVTNSAEDILLVDVGGGEGSYLRQFMERFPGVSGRFFLQDLPHVVSSIKNDTLPGVELIGHDFFTPQPIKGARAYFMHWILHDWSDEHCRSILSNIVAAMKPGYSKLIIHERILSDTNGDVASASLSIMMMVQVAAFERSEKQWRELLESVGLREIRFYYPPASGEGIIEALL
ncbi:hypothetical protein UA08_06370 [Talaromyces atroroseus]|uniref:O-methyltransferase C-terminal domain-containing protein n=1 Tax=Talaromyces atroroseus TaxID=1441469 RepID=A0A225ABR9_TALAT|nr:hypothetical protein UA08_06370 [Talaromyces atroroseus]OKL58531.1 hypothetical protein UA08_06370 [Talaromyces atroroseus]